MSDYFIADDLSGALDAAAAFHHAGRRVTVALSSAPWPEGEPGEVIGITTETRNASAADAARVVSAVIARGRSRGARLLYKKIDSTLRGPVAAELAALQEALPGASILFAPANPLVGRTVRDGVLLVNGVPVAESEFAHDPLSPVRESSIRVLLGPAAMGRVVIAEAETEQDLSLAVAGTLGRGGHWVPIGSGALARSIAMREKREAERTRLAANLFPVPGPSLFICGSAQERNRAQAWQLSRISGTPMHEVAISGGEGVTGLAIQSVARTGSATLLMEPTRGESAAAVRAMVRTARDIITETRVARVFVTGGETAFALGQELGVSCLTFIDELESGLSLSLANARNGSMLWAVKPGGFGDEQTWVRAWHALARH